MKRQSIRKSVKNTLKSVKAKIDFKKNTIFEKETFFEGKPFKIRGIVDFTKPDIMLEERK